MIASRRPFPDADVLVIEVACDLILFLNLFKRPASTSILNFHMLVASAASSSALVSSTPEFEDLTTP